MNAQTCDYDTFCKKLDKRVNFLDEQPKQNKKRDRVIAFSLEFPIPDGIADDKVREFSTKVNRLIFEQIGAENFLGSYIHFDEVHDYTDAETNEERTSMRHVHTIVTSAIDNHLNAKAMSSKQNMIKLNNAIQEMSLNDYGVAFMTGSKKKSRDEVETLKNKSLKRENERLQRENEKLRQAAISLENERKSFENQRAAHAEIVKEERAARALVQSKEEALNNREKELDNREISLDNRENALNERERALNEREDELPVVSRKSVLGMKSEQSERSETPLGFETQSSIHRGNQFDI
ncbi:MAG: hypothetical protein NC299_09735 [Lachnospiraceae bacterium]|nr:hypothetical protein [Lachnospiraceae bacterium]